MELLGFNIYRDGVKINTDLLPLDTEEFVDAGLPVGVEYTYVVVAVYKEGEAPSNESTAIPYALIKPVLTTEAGLNKVTLKWHMPKG